MTETKNLKRVREIKGVVLVSLGLFFLLCLFSYSPEDPSFTHYVTDRSHVSNLIGLLGSCTSDSLIRLLGGSVFFLPLFLFVAGYRFLMHELFRIRALHLLGFFGLVLSTSVLLDMAPGSFSISGVKLPAGGLLGLGVFGFLDARLNVVGTILIMVSIGLISLMVMSNFSVVFTAKILSRITLFSWLKTHGLFSSIRDKWNVKKIIRSKDNGRAPKIVTPVEDIPPVPAKDETKKAEQMPFDFVLKRGIFRLPSLTLLSEMPHKDTKVKKETLIANSRILEKKLADFGVEGRVVEVRPGPVITMYELEPAAGVKSTK